MTDKDKIAIGECVSPSDTAERCGSCIDKCQAFENWCKLQKELNKNGIKRSN